MFLLTTYNKSIEGLDLLRFFSCLNTKLIEKWISIRDLSVALLNSSKSLSTLASSSCMYFSFYRMAYIVECWLDVCSPSYLPLLISLDIYTQTLVHIPSGIIKRLLFFPWWLDSRIEEVFLGYRDIYVTGNGVLFTIVMPSSRPKPSEIAVEAKKTYIPYIRDNFSEHWPTQSFLCYSDSIIAGPSQTDRHCRFGKLILTS